MKSIFLSIVLLTLAISTPALAGRVKRLAGAQPKASVDLDAGEDWRVGDKVEIQSDSGSCGATVSRLSGRRALIEWQDCGSVKVAPGMSALKSTADTPDDSPAQKNGRITAGLQYSTADKLKYKGRGDLFGVETEFSATEQTTPAFGLNVGYLYRRPWSLGFSAQLAYEMARPSKGIEGRAGNLRFTGQYDKKLERSLVLTEANGNFSLGSHAYVYGGANYPFVSSSDDVAKYTGLFGYQAGVGAVFFDRFGADLGYRMVRMKGSINAGLRLEIENAEFSGFVLSTRYLF